MGEMKKKTIGNKIRCIRKFRGCTQAELGKMVGLSGDRIRQYENDIRKPKEELLKKLAIALKVNLAAISDTNISNFDDVMHILFLLEDVLKISINKNNNQYSLIINDIMQSKTSLIIKLMTELIQNGVINIH